MNNPKILKAIVVILLLLNTGTLVFMWVHRPPPPPGDTLVREIGFDAEQTGQFEALRQAHRSEMSNYRQQNGGFRDQLFRQLAQPVGDTLQVARLTDSIADRQKQMELLTFRHFSQVRGLCRPEQQSKFDSIIGDVLKNLGAQQPPPRR